MRDNDFNDDKVNTVDSESKIRTAASQIRRYALIGFGLVILNFAYVMVTVPHGIINGGVTSFSMILSRLPLTELLPVNAWVTIVTALLALLCFVFLGRDIFIASLYSCVVGVAAFNFFTLIIPKGVIDAMVRIGYMGDNPVIPIGMAVELILAAIIVGTGYYFCLSNDSTAVGMDTIALILHKRNEKIPVAYAMYAINILVLLLGLYAYGLRCVLMGIAFAGIQALTLHTLLKCRGEEDGITILDKARALMVFVLGADFIRLAVSSCICMVIDLAIFHGMGMALDFERAALEIFIATLTARIISSLINYVINRKWVFDSNAAVGKSMLRYYILAAFIMLMSWLLVTILVHFSGADGIYRTGLKFCTDCCLFIVSYFTQKKWVFKSTEIEDTEIEKTETIEDTEK